VGVERPFPLRFLFASRPEVMGAVLGIVYRCIATHLTKKAGFSRKTAQAGAVTLIQRFGSELNLNVHFRMLFLDGVYVERPDGVLRFRWVKEPTGSELARLTQTLALRIGRYLERQGVLERERHRLSQHLTIQDVSDAAAVSRGMLSRIENGQATPSLDALTRICKALGVSLGGVFKDFDATEGAATFIPKGEGMDVARRGTRRGHAYELLS